jgi:hypothetical protein
MQKHSFAHTFRAKIKHGRLKKGAHQPPTLKKNITMVESFAMASLPATLFAIPTALFIAVAVARPPTLSPSPLPCRPHPPCCLPPSLPPQSLLPPSPLLLLASHPRRHCHHSCHRRQCHCHRLPRGGGGGCRPWWRRQCWQPGNKVNEDKDNNMTTT